MLSSPPHSPPQQPASAPAPTKASPPPVTAKAQPPAHKAPPTKAEHNKTSSEGGGRGRGSGKGAPVQFGSLLKMATHPQSSRQLQAELPRMSEAQLGRLCE